MVWVRSEYAGELAVLSVWASALIPWSVSFDAVEGVQLVVVRFQFFLVQYLLGVSLGAQEQPFQTVVAAVDFEQGAVQEAYVVWLAGAAVFAVAFLASVAYYAAEERVEAGPVDPVRALGALLVVVGVVETVAVWQLWHSYPGTLVPVGVVFLYVFGGALLTVDRT